MAKRDRANLPIGTVYEPIGLNRNQAGKYH